jgi:uncharacterized protein DUF3310
LSYFRSTYQQHYAGKNGQRPVQVVDLLAANDILEPFCRGAIVKYILRYGRKGGKSRLDLLKAAHYLVMLLNENQEVTN